MQSKSLLIAIAAFAVSATGVQAYGGMQMLVKSRLNNDQVEAIEEARELKKSGNFTAARDRLVEAGIAEDELRILREASKFSRGKIHEALEDGDYNSFKITIADSPLADIITTEVDFKQLKKAYELRQAGEWDEATGLVAELGINKSEIKLGKEGGQMRRHEAHLTIEQREVLSVARQANDHATVQAVLAEAGIERSAHGRKGRTSR